MYTSWEKLFEKSDTDYAPELHLHLDGLKKQLINDRESMPANFMYEVNRLRL